MQFEEGEKVIDFLLKNRVKLLPINPKSLNFFLRKFLKMDLLEHYLTCIMSLVV